MKPIIILNFKTYKESFQKNALSLAAMCESVTNELDATIIVVPSLLDLKQVAESVSIPVFSQHVDIDGFGAHTGHVLIPQLKELGVSGTLINHSERQVSLKHIILAVRKAKEYEITTIVCVSSLEKLKEVLEHCNPDYVAYEPKELIGGDISVTSAKPDIIKEAYKLVSNTSTKLLCGAGVKTNQDVKGALELGCVGVLLASGVVKKESPELALKNLIMGQ